MTEPWGFCVGAQVDRTDQEIEHIARAFFVARHETGVWETASRVLKHEFRLYARHALSMLELKQEYTIIIVTHNMQQAARVSDRTAFFTARPDETTGNRTGVLVEFDRTEKIFSNPGDRRTEDYISGRFG